MTSILDTNVLLRFLVGDHKKQKDQAITWFKEAANGERVIVVKPLVIAEAVFVLESFYKHSREDIVSSMLPLLAMPVLDVEERDVLVHLWDEFLSGLHFVDAYLLTAAKRTDQTLLSFDKQLIRRAHS